MSEIPQYNDINLQENIDNLFVNIYYVKRHSHHFYGYRITMLCIDRGPSKFCEMSEMVTISATDPPT